MGDVVSSSNCLLPTLLKSNQRGISPPSGRNELNLLSKLFVLTESISLLLFLLFLLLLLFCFVLFCLQGLFTGKSRKVPTCTVGTKEIHKGKHIAIESDMKIIRRFRVIISKLYGQEYLVLVIVQD